MEKIYHADRCQKEVGMVILTLEKVDFRAKNTGDKEVPFMMMKRSFDQEGITMLKYLVYNSSFKVQSKH